MKITMYELLGMVKDGKAPKKVKYCEYVWKFCNNGVYSSYWFNDIELQDYLDRNILENLNDEVEIIEEEKKIPEKIRLYTLSNNDSADFTTLQDFNNRDIQRVINWILDYLKNKGDE